MSYAPTGSTTADMIFTGFILVAHLAMPAVLGYVLGRMHRKPEPRPVTFSEFRAKTLKTYAEAFGLPKTDQTTVPMPPVKPPREQCGVCDGRGQYKVINIRDGTVDHQPCPGCFGRDQAVAAFVRDFPWPRQCPCGDPECKEGP